MHHATARWRPLTLILILATAALSLLPAASLATEKMGRWNTRPKDQATVPQTPPPNLHQLRWSPGDGKVQSPINNADVQVFPSTNPQTEVSIAINPANPLNMLITSNTTPTSTGQGYYYTFDGGVTWAGSDAYPNGNANYGDPVSVFAANGTAYDVTLRSPSGIGRVASTDGGVTWGPFLNIDPTNSSGDDKEHAITDNSPGSPYLNSFYCAWTDFNLAPRVVLVTSNDGFSTQHLIDAALGGDFGQGVNLQVGPGGVVYACWAVYTGGFLPETGMGFARSLDGGITWSPASVIFPYSGIRTSNGQNALFNNTRVNSFPSMAVDISGGTHNGRIYITYSDRSTGDSDIYLRYSDDQGATWSAAIRVNPDPVNNGKQQWFNWATCDPLTGDLSVAYYSMDTGGAGFQTKYWVSHSTDGGNTFDSFAVSDVYFIPTELGGSFAAGYQGDYCGITSWNGKAFPAWCDNRTGQYNNYFEAVVYADPTDPNAPGNLSAVSDCNTPTSITVNWVDPTTLVNGTPLTSFEILATRNGTPLAPTPMGVQTFTDGGLTTGQLYTYELRTHDLTTDSLSVIVSISKYAGGDPVPAPPTLFTVTSVPGPGFQLDWTNPSTNRDGSVLCDFAGINVYRNGVLLTTLGRLPGAIGTLDTYTDMAPVPGLNCYKLAAIDSEVPQNESAFTTEICVEVPLQPPFCDQFPTAGAPDNGKWTTGGVVVDTVAANPPSPPNAADFMGTCELDSRPIDMNGKGGLGYVLIYQKEQTGNGESADAGNDLIIEMLNSNGTWDEITRHLGSDPDEVNFTTHVFNLDALVPSAGTFFHSQFKFRFRATGDPGFDNWFVDNVCLDIPNCQPTITVNPLAISDALVAGTPAGSVIPVTVSNSCAFNALVWSATVNPAVSWLTLAGNSGTVGGVGSQNFSATFNAIGMVPGVYTTNIDVTSNDPVNPLIVVTATLTVNAAPVIGVAPNSLTHTLANTDPPVTDTVIISNTGGGPLTFNIYDAAAGVHPFNKTGLGSDGPAAKSAGPAPVAVPVVKPNPAKAAWYAAPMGISPVDATIGRNTLSLESEKEPGDHKKPWWKNPGDRGQDRHLPPQPFSMGGPDAAGYHFIDSDQAGGPLFGWVEISGVGTPTGVTGDDQNGGPFNLGFAFSHYGNTYNSVRVCSNGWLSFTSTSTSLSNTVLPSTSAPFDLMAPYYDDLNPSVGGTIYYYQDVANDRFIVEWSGVPHYGATLPNTFQVIINKNGTILYQYLDIAAPANSATVGVQNGDGTIGLQVAYNQAYVHNGLAVLIYQDAPWLTVSPLAGTVPPSGSTPLLVTSNPTGMVPGTYYGNVIISSNDPVTPITQVHVTLSVTGIGAALPFCDDFNQTTGVPDPAKWTTGGVTVDGVGLNEPSPPNSARFNGTDVLTSIQLNLGGLAGTGQVLRYYYEKGGGGDVPETGNDLIVEFQNSNGTWDEVQRQLGGGTAMSSYNLALVSLDAAVPSSGTFFHPLFKMRIRGTGEAGTDDWFVDDLCIQVPPCQPTVVLSKTSLCDTLVAGSTGDPKDVFVSNSCGFAVLTFTVTETPDQTWLDVTPMNGSVSGAGSTPLSFTFNAVGMLPGLYNTTVHVLSNDPVNPDVAISVCLKVTGAPHAVITPDSICVVAYDSQPTHATLTVANTGPVALNWRLTDTKGLPAAPGGIRALGTTFVPAATDVAPNLKKLEMFAEYLDLVEPAPEPGQPTDVEAKGYTSPFRGGVQPYGAGGPDGFGYRWIDSDQAGGPPFEWVELQGNGGIDTGLHGDDVNLGPFNLGFTMPFYGTNYNSVRVCSNGWLSFTSTSTAYSNTALPNTALPNATIAPLWDDYDMRNNVGICLYRSDAALGRFIVEWKKVTRYLALTDTLTFQAILYKDGTVQYNYLSVKGVLNSNTIGIENSTGTVGLQVVYNANYVHSGLTVLIQAEQPWLSVTPTSGTVGPNGTQLLDVVFDPTGQSLGIHRGWLHIPTNDPLLPIKQIPVCMDVQPPIAVALSRFEASSTPDGVGIVWETSSEKNHSHFDILRSETLSGSYTKINAAPITGNGHYEYQDAGVVDGRTYWYRLDAVDRSGGRQQFGPLSVTYEGRPSAFALVQNYPNPFSSRTTFRLDLPGPSPVSVRIFDAVGRLVKTFADGSTMNGGRYTWEWDGRDNAGNRSAAGFYFLRAETPAGMKTVRMMLVR